MHISMHSESENTPAVTHSGEPAGIYRTEGSLSYTTTLEVASAYSTERHAAAGKRPNITGRLLNNVASAVVMYARSEDELDEFGGFGIISNSMKNFSIQFFKPFI
jgi:hypothetical protein